MNTNIAPQLSSKKAIEQALLLRGSVDFESTDAYMWLVNQQVALPNAGRSERFAEEQQVMKSLNVRRLDAFSKETARVSRGSLIRVQGNQSINGPRYLFLVRVPFSLSAVPFSLSAVPFPCLYRMVWPACA